jgi:hypothetical protein
MANKPTKATKAAPKAAKAAPKAAPKAANADAPSAWALRATRVVAKGEQCMLSNGWTFTVPAVLDGCSVQHLDAIAWPIRPSGSVWHLANATAPDGAKAKGVVLLHANPRVSGVARSGANGTWTVRVFADTVLHGTSGR